MRLALALLLAAAVFAAAPAAAKGSKAEVIAKIEALLEEGDLDGAKEMIDHFLARNAEDPDLLRLLDAWRVRKGGLAEFVEGEGLEKPENRERLRAAALRVVRATMRGNPDEWAGLRGAVDDRTFEALLVIPKVGGTPEDMRVAEEMLAPPAPASERTPEALLAAAAAGRDERLSALREAEARKLAAMRPEAEKALAGAGDDAETRAAAAAVLLALGDEKPRAGLVAALSSERAVDAVEAMQVLARHPGKGAKPRQALYAEVEKSEKILGRLKPTLQSLLIEALGRPPAEPGAREFLEGLLASPVHHVDAARALGALGDPAALTALLAYLRAPLPSDEEDPAGGGLGFLGQAEGLRAAAAAEEVRPYLVAAIAILRVAK